LKKLDFIHKDRLHEVTMLVLKKMPFEDKNSNVTALANAVSEQYLDVYNFFIEKYHDQEDHDNADNLQGLFDLTTTPLHRK
jgi:hypothetical protein